MKMPLGKTLGSPSASSWIGQVLEPFRAALVSSSNEREAWGWRLRGAIYPLVSSSVSVGEREGNLCVPFSADHGQLAP